MLVHAQQIAAHACVRPLGGALSAAQRHAADPRRHTIAAREETRHTRPAPAIGDDELVLHGRQRLVAAGVTLAPAATEELTIDATRLVTLGGDDVKASTIRHAESQPDIGSPAGHVRRHGDLARGAGVGDDGRFLAILTRVEDAMRQPGVAEEPAQMLDAATDRVPSSTGRPRRFTLWTRATTACQRASDEA